jgi:hypothetical protein
MVSTDKKQELKITQNRIVRQLVKVLGHGHPPL